MAYTGSRSQSGRDAGHPAVPGRNSLLAAGALLIALLGLFLLIDSTDGDAGAKPALAAPELSPPLKLPWEDGYGDEKKGWLTGVSGLHGGKDALDFLPPDSPLNLTVTCEGGPGWVPAESQFWVVAAAAGTVTQASDSTVVIDHGNGWISGYYHISSFQVQPGDTVPPRWALGHPSNYGDCSTGPQVHFWALGPNGQTLRDVKISGQDATSIGINVRISETGNYPPAPGATPTATPAATPVPSLTPNPTTTPTPTPTAVPTPTPTPTPTPAPKQPATAKADVDCDGDIDAVDALKEMRYIAGLPLSQTEPCLEIGTGGDWVFGDVDCDDDVDAVDTLKILRHVATLPVPRQSTCAPTDSVPQPAPQPAPTPAPTPVLTPAPSPTAAGQGSPFSLTNLQAAWEGMGIDVTVGQPSSGFTGFGATAVDVGLIQLGDSMGLSVLVYESSESASQDWALVPGAPPAARAGRSLPAHLSTWWNENIVVVIHWKTGDISTAALAGFLGLGS